VRTVWTYDHLMWTQLRDGPWYGCVPLLAAAAAGTRRVRLGTQVATPNYRHPVPFAKELMTLDQLSGGRLEVGLGAGVEGPDASVLGDPPRSRRERTDRFAEWLGLLDQLDRVEDRRARYVSELVIVSPAGEELRGTGMLEGRIAAEPRGTEGFGFDPIFVPDGEGRTVAELGNFWKRENSHRAKAARSLLIQLGKTG